MNTTRSLAAALLAMAALLAAGLANTSVWLVRTVGDEARVRHVAEHLVTSEKGQALLAKTISDVAAPVLGGDAYLLAHEAAGDQRVRATAVDALMGAYRTARGDTSTVLDGAPVAAALADAARRLDPNGQGAQLGDAIASYPLSVALPGAPAPMRWALGDGPGRMLALSTAVAVAAGAAAVLIAPRRSALLVRFARMLFGAAAVTATVAVVLPWALGQVDNTALVFAGELLGAAAGGLIVVAAVEVAAALALWWGSKLVDRDGRGAPPFPQVVSGRGQWQPAAPPAAHPGGQLAGTPAEPWRG